MEWNGMIGVEDPGDFGEGPKVSSMSPRDVERRCERTDSLGPPGHKPGFTEKIRR